MNPSSLRPLLLLGCLLAAPLGAHASTASPDTLADSTVVEHWRLDNGLRVVTRHIPNTGVVAITVAYASGSDDDPPGREGLAQLLGEVAFTGPAGDLPERTREDLDSQRPMGWSYPVSRRSSLFTEVASVEQLPGVLSQVAARMRGVKVTKEVLAAALKNVRAELGQQLFGPPTTALYHQVREVALDRKDEDLLRRASGRDLAKLTPQEVQQQLARVYVPANAVLALAGDLSQVEVRPLIRNLFGDIPGGPAPPRAKPAPLEPRSRVMRLAGLQQAAGVIGIIAPALGDSLHPSFYLNALLLGSHFSQMWQQPGNPTPTPSHHYAVLDEPDLMRVFPPVDPGATGADAVHAKMGLAMNTLTTLIVTREPYEALRASTRWLLGGPMPPEVAKRAGRETAVVHTLARSMASRILWGGDPFWRDYLERFEREPPGGLSHWIAYFNDPKHQVRLLMLPRP